MKGNWSLPGADQGHGIAAAILDFMQHPRHLSAQAMRGSQRWPLGRRGSKVRTFQAGISLMSRHFFFIPHLLRLKDCKAAGALPQI